MKTSHKIAGGIVLITGLGFFIYVLLRAVMVQVTYDEVGTLTEYVQKPWLNIFIFTKVSANNHILNSLLMKVSTGLFGISELALRLPNVLAYLLYMFFAWMVLRRITGSPLLLITGFILLNAHPYLLDFFSLARGYGLASALMMGSVYFLLVFIQYGKNSSVALAYVFAALACLSNLALLNFYLALIFMHLLTEWKRWKAGEDSRNIRKHILTALVISLLTGAVLLLPIIKLNTAQELYFGRGTSFWQSTVMSLINSLAYSAPYYDKVLPFVSSFVAFTVITGLNILLYHLFFRGSFRISPVTVFTILLFVTALSTIAQFHLLGTLFLIQRTALFFVPLFFLLFISILQIIWGRYQTKLLAPGIAACTAALLVFHFIVSANLRSTED